VEKPKIKNKTNKKFTIIGAIHADVKYGSYKKENLF